MRKLRVALVILLLLAFVAASQTGLAVTTNNIGDSLSMGKSKATLEQIKNKLAAGNSDIAKQNQLMTAYTKYMAKNTLDSVSNGISAGKKNTRATIKPPSTAGMSVPLSGIGSAVKALGSINVGIMDPAAIAKSISIPRLAILK